MEKKLYDLAFTINANYIGQFKVTFASACSSDGNVAYRAHVIHNGIGEEDLEDLRAFCAARGGEAVFYLIDDSAFEGLPKMGYDSAYTAYLKVLLPYCLSHLKKVLYLDCDIIVKGSLVELFESDFGAFIACAPDFGVNGRHREHVQKITGQSDAVYFNSGVMLFDFAYRGQIVEKSEIFEYIRENAAIIRWHDQDILNAFYFDKYAPLNEKYNYLTTYKSLSDAFTRKGAKGATVLHYANWKPWKADYIGKCYAPYKKTYKALIGERHVDFLKRRSPFSQLKLILKYVFKRKK